MLGGLKKSCADNINKLVTLFEPYGDWMTLSDPQLQWLMMVNPL